MVVLKDYGDVNVYRAYYKAQAGRGLPGFHGSVNMYGAGLGGIFRGLFRKAVPLLRRGFEFIKPHIKTAVHNIAGDVASHVMKKVRPQEGSGLTYMKRRGGVKRKAGHLRLGPPKRLNSGLPPKKRQKLENRKKKASRKIKGLKRCRGDIF